uniref:Peptidase S1 domain-containing protein n=1 Tax=Heliothis virescens TaxID=7102 RepID=A0A2A4J4C8_HELVI
MRVRERKRRETRRTETRQQEAVRKEGSKNHKGEETLRDVEKKQIAERGGKSRKRRGEEGKKREKEDREENGMSKRRERGRKGQGEEKKEDKKKGDREIKGAIEEGEDRAAGEPDGERDRKEPVEEKEWETPGGEGRDREGKLSHVAIGVLTRAETSDPSKIYKVKQFISHPNYKSPQKYNDIGLVRTEKTMELTHLTVPACLHTGEPVDASQVLAAGWGLLHTNAKETSEHLQKAVLDQFSIEDCTTVYASLRLLKNGFDTTTQYCYGDKGTPKPFQGQLESKDTCQGDSGGPIVIKDSKIHCMYTIVGVTSFGKYCGFNDSPGLYTNVVPYLPWIEGIVWPN